MRGIRTESGIVETRVQNLTWEHISPPIRKRGWRCGKCSITMKLLSISKDIPAEYWRCYECNKQIPLEQRDAVFDEIIQAVKEKYNFHVFSYDREHNTWDIQSSEWVTLNGTRLDSKRKRISSNLKKDIIGDVKAAIQHTLEIEIDSIKDLFIDA
jgi:hypothetical protein